MAKEDSIRCEGKVIELLPNAMFRVQLEGSQNIVLAYLGGKLRQHSINILLGDPVLLEMSPYDLTKARIVFRK